MIPTSMINSGDNTFRRDYENQDFDSGENSDAESVPQEDESYYCTRNLEKANGAQYSKLAL